MGRRIPMVVGGKKQVLAGDQPNQQGATPDTKESHPCQCSEDTRKIFVTGVDVINSFVKQNKANDDQSHRLQKSNLRWVKVSACVLTIYTTITALQWRALMETNRLSRESFEKTQRAVVYLGRPDGKIGEFLLGKDVLRIVLYFRNFGPSIARNTVIEVWPITTSPGQPPVKTHFLPPSKDMIGPGIPPRSPHTVYVPYRDATREELNSQKKSLQVAGRIGYTDVFGHYCETFTLHYNAPPLEKFSLAPDAFPDLCDSKEDEVKSGIVRLQPGMGNLILPFPESPPPHPPGNFPK